MKQKRSKVGELIRKVPFIGQTFYQTVVSLNKRYNSLKNKYNLWFRKNQAIRSVKDFVDHDSSLDVSIIGKFYVFHN